MIKRLFLSFTILFIFCGKNLPPPKNDYEFYKNVIAEVFTSTSCTYCPVAESLLSELKKEYKDSLIIVKYHIGSSDPFNFSGSEERQGYYGITQLPTVIFDGVNKVVGVTGSSYELYRNEIESRRELRSPFTIFLNGFINNEKINYNVKILSDYSSDTIQLPEEKVTKFKFFIVLCEDSIQYNAPNGLNIHNYVSRYIYSQDIPGEFDDTLIINGEIDIDTLWNKVRFTLVSYIQDIDKKEIFQSVMQKINFTSIYDFSIFTSDTIKSSNINKPVEFPLTITNTGNTSDSFYLDIPDSLLTPSTLMASLCDTFSCYPLPYIFELKPNETITSLEVHLTPQEIGNNKAVLVITSKKGGMTKLLNLYVEASK